MILSIYMFGYIYLFNIIESIPIREDIERTTNFRDKNIKIFMRAESTWINFQSQSLFTYPFTLVSLPPRGFVSSPVSQPSVFEVYCPISCKKIRIGAIKDKTKEATEFNTTASRWVSTLLNQNIKYLINNNPPLKKDKKKVQGSGWCFWVEVNDKGNYAIFNPYCVITGQPLSLYTFEKLPKIQKEIDIHALFKTLQSSSKLQTLQVNGKKLYLKQTKSGSFIGVNNFFEDDPNSAITLVYPQSSKILKINTNQAIKLISQNKNYWLNQLSKVIDAQQTGEVAQPFQNLDLIFQRLQITLNLEEQIRAKLMNNAGIAKCSQNYSYHPRLYSAWTRLASFINYGNTKYNTTRLAQLGFYNKSDMLQDLAFYQHPEIPIPASEDPAYLNQADLRKKLFPFSRIERGLPSANVPLSAVTSSILHQTISEKPILFKEVHGHYALFVDEDYNISLWSCKFIPIKLFSLNAKSECQRGNTGLVLNQNQVVVNVSNAEKEQAGLASLFDEGPATKQVKAPEVVVADQSMVEQMMQMGYGVNISKKALLAVKNQSIPAAIDMIDQITSEEKKKKVEQRRQWTCPICTYINKAEIDTCQMCGQFCDLAQQAQKQRIKQQQQTKKVKEHQKQLERLKLQKEKEEQKLRKQQEQAQKLRLIQQKQEQLKKSRLINVNFVIHSTPIDPFFVILLFRNEQKQFSILKVVRFGINRQYFSRFYKIEDKIIVGNSRRFPLPASFNSLSQIASQNIDAIEWGIKLIEASNKQQWIVSQMKEIELEFGLQKIQVSQNASQFQIIGEKTHIFKINTKDGEKLTSFELTKINEISKSELKNNKQVVEVALQQSQYQIASGEQLILDEKVTQVSVEVLEHLPSGKWQKIPAGPPISIQNPAQGQVTMNEFVPLVIEHFQGSVFSGKHYSCSLLQKSSNLYISNYPNANFTFRHDTSKRMFIQKVVIISSSKRLQRIFAVFEGLIFTANEPTWFHLAKERFANFTKSDYENWLSCKKARNNHRQFWQPVGFFKIENEAEVELDYKRSAKYIFLLPTSVKNSVQKKKEDVYAIKIDFFGVKGRVEEQKSYEPWYNSYRNEGKSECSAFIANHIEGKEEPINPANISLKNISQVNSFNFLLKNYSLFEKSPVSATTIFTFRIRDTQHKKVIKINSNYSKKIIVRTKKDVSQQVDYTTISTFSELAKAQNQIALPQIKKMAQRLDLKELLLLLLASDQECSRYQTLMNKIEDAPLFRETLFQKMIELIPLLVNEDIKIMQTGFKFFLTLYEKALLTQSQHSFRANTQALKRIIQYVGDNRSKNYNLLRSKYNIEQLALQPYLFSKDYYRQIHPGYVEKEPTVLSTVQPSGSINNCLWIEQLTPYAYRQIIDLQETKRVESIKFFIPKIASVNFRPKLQISIFSVEDQGDRLLYTRYFHEDFLVQYGVNGFKDSQIYRGSRLNCFTVANIQADLRIIKVQISFLLLTSQPHIKYKDTAQKFYIIPLVDYRDSNHQSNVSKQLELLKTFPQQPRHLFMNERLPPAKYLTEGSKSIFHIYEFPKIQASQAKKEYRQIVDKITTNILDETIVREALGNLKINNYEFNRKGLDFAYTYAIYLMNFNRKYQIQLRISVDLALKIFQTLVVFEIGPIAKKAFGFLQQTYKRFTNLQKATFADALIDRYLLNIEQLPNIKISDRYSPLNIIQKIQQFQLPVANLVTKLQKYINKPLTLILIKLIQSVSTAHGVGSLQKYCVQSGKYSGKLQLIDLSNVAFKVSLWILDNVHGIKQQALIDGLDLLLLFISGEVLPFTPQQRLESAKLFIEKLDQKKLWKLVFLTLKLKSQALKERINKLFTVLTANLTEQFKKSTNQMVQQIISRQEGSIYVEINQQLTQQQWMNHLQITLELISLTKNTVVLDQAAALKLLQLPLTRSLWSRALNIIPRNDNILLSIIKNFPMQYYNSLGKQIAQFCQPLTDLKSLESIHVNWLDLIRQLRLEGKSLFDLFVLQLQKSSFGGREGLTSATVNDVHQLQVSSELLKLLLQSKISNQHYTEENIRKLIQWYFLNKSKEKGCSPATDKLLFLSQSIKSLFQKIIQNQEAVKRAIKCLLQIRAQSGVIERNFEEKRIPIHSALTLNKRFCECFEELLGLFMTTDALCSYFAFDLKGLNQILQTMDISNSKEVVSSFGCTPDEQLLLSQKIVATRINREQPTQIKELDDLKEQQFANNVKLVPLLNTASINATNADWTTNKKGTKTKVIFLPLNQATTFNQYPLYLQLARTAQVRSIKVGFVAASYEHNDKLVATPSAVIVEGSSDGINFEPIGQMDYIQDDAYITNGVQVWALNCQKLKGLHAIGEAVQSIGLHKVKYLKLIVRRPTVTFIEGQYSQINGKIYNVLGCNLSFLSVVGDDCEKHSFALSESCKEISKRSSLNLLSALLNESNPITMRQISNDESLQKLFRQNFKRLRDYMTKYPQVMPSVIYLIGAGNRRLGDWIVQSFLSDGGGQRQAKIINQIIISTPDRAFARLSQYLRSIFKKLQTISGQSQIQSGLLYAKQIHLIQSFCKTLQECYEMRLSGGILEVKKSNIDHIIDIYDKKHSSPQIKSLVKLLIHLIHIRAPLSLSDSLIVTVMELVWKNCTQIRPHFYTLMAGLLIDRKAGIWLRQSGLSKIDQLIQSIYSSITHNQYKNLKLQLSLLGQVSYHESGYLRDQLVHIQLYHRLKSVNHQDSQIIEAVLRILRNIVLGNTIEQQKMANILLEDVGLLVKKRDPFLQKLFVGLLGLESEVMIHVSGLDLQSPVKKQAINSKFLTKKNQKVLLDKINKKYKYSLLGQINGSLLAQNQDTFLKAFSCGALLMILRFKINEQNHTIAIYSPTASKRNQQGQYFWEQIINYQKTGFVCVLQENQPLFVTQQSPETMLANIYGGDQEQDNAAVIYDDSQEIIQFTFNTTESTVPKITLKKYNKKLPEELTSSILDQDYEGYSFVGLQFWQLRAQSSVNVSDSKITTLLSKSNQAKPPFSYYRHSPIYLFPANITLSKFVTILGLKGSCTTKGRPLQSDRVLSELQKQSGDFIIDLQIQTQEDNKSKPTEQVLQIGYIPVMTIFSHFSKLQGVNEVLRLGTESLKDWRKADRKKNFQHYMQQLKSFINLPNFFNLFIKNQQYVTLLFEVAAGLPDDQNSTRNWEEEYVNNFRFIYKIVSDIFKYDRSPQLRNMDKYSDFLDVILQKLSEIKKEAPRVIRQQSSNNNNEEPSVANLQLQKVKSQDRKRKKKGTGYGADNQNSSKWSPSEWQLNQRNVSQQALKVISIIASFLDCEQPLVDERFTQSIKQSCLLPVIQSALRSGSLLDISKQSELFKSYLHIVRLLASHPVTVQCLLDIEKIYKPQQSESIINLLTKLNGIAQIFTECLKSGKQQVTTNESAENISLDIQRTFALVDKAVKNLKKKKKNITMKQIDNLPVAEAYRILLSGHRFGYVNLKENGVFKHAHSGSISTSAPATSKVLRLSQQLADLSSSLPCEHTNSIFVRCDRSRVDVINVLIMGSKDTPYSNGAFTFDVYCDDSYPNNPPKMLITTTGQGKIRFNPNLYSCGKVCLSLLGTWRGSASQNWDPKVSTLLQLFISTQGITMSDDVYFNEPGFEGQQGTEEGQRKNEAYSNIVRLGNVRYAMVGQIKNPPKGFEEVIKRHFYAKRKQIIEQCQKWLQYAEKREASYNGLVNDHNSSWCAQLKQSKTKYRQLLLKQVNELKQILNNLPPPDLKSQQQEQPAFQKEKAKEKIVNITQQLKLQEVDVDYDKGLTQVKEYQEGVMQDRWSRYIGAMGLQAVKKQAESSVLLIGLKPLGLQIAKNLVLSGLKKLTVLEPDTIKDHNEHFYMSNLKGESLKQCIFKIKQLNPYMLVEHVQSLPLLSQYSIVISTEDYQKSLQLAELSRTSQTKFIWAETRGTSGIYFADLGQHEVNDDNGQQPFEGIIKNITNEQQGLVTLLDGVKHPYQDGDYVSLSKIQGMKDIAQIAEEKSQAQIFFEKQSKEKVDGINNRLYKIKVVNWNSFRIGDTRNFTQYKGNGLCKNIKIPRKIQFKSLGDCSKSFETHLDSNLGIYDFEKLGDTHNIFLCFQALSQFKLTEKASPKNWDIKDSEKFNQILTFIAQSIGKSTQQIQKLKQFGKIFSMISEAELPTIGAYLGGIVAQQAIKAITNKYMPIRQFFSFHFNQMIQKLPQLEAEIQKKHIIQGEQFRNLKIVVGKEGAQKIAQLKTFVIGAGAIGCQLLKNFAMINMGSKGEILVTDPDHIETSNLSRQFLFRQKHVKKAKSATACATLLQLNPRLEGHIIARLDKVCEETEQVFSNQFFCSRNIVANALDNVKARQYMDKRCVENKVPLFESGTLGPKGHVQVIVPYKTENYGSQNDPNEQAQIPHCTLKMFPQETVHCIEWARDIFGKIFTLNPKALKKVIQAKDLYVLQGQEKQTVARMIKYRPESFDDCIAQAVRKFYVCFRNNVRQLLFTYPLDLKTKEGKLFWNLPKRPPTQISQIDPKDDNHQVFIASYAVLLAKIYNIPYPKDFRKADGKQKIIEVALKVKVEDFVPNEEASKELEKEVEKQAKKEQKQIEQPKLQVPTKLEQKLSQQIEITSQLLDLKISPQEFEKDEDSNGHIDLIYSMSNLRCQNYGLEQCTWIDAKLKAGKIMAALSTTTSVVAALQTIQIIKLAVECNTWRNGFINLAVPLIQISEPGPAMKHKIGSSQFTIWQDWSFKAKSLRDLLQQLRDKYQVQGFNISTSYGKPVYWQAMYKDKQESRQTLLDSSLKDLFAQEHIELHIAMKNSSTGQIYQNVPKVKVTII